MIQWNSVFQVSRNERGATMIETAIALPVFLAFIIFSIGFSAEIAQQFRFTQSVKLAGRAAVVNAQSSSYPTIASCTTLVQSLLNTQAARQGFHTPTAPQVTVERQEQNSIRGLKILATADLSSFFSLLPFHPGQIQSQAFFPLEDQNACQP